MTLTSKLFKWFMVALVALLPALAMAANANPDGGTDWELFVYGNGQVVYEIFNGIKLLMVPDAGETGFRSLLLVLATLGFLVLAIAAGFDPGKNLMKMFGFVFVVWGVIFSATGLTANVLIIDLVKQDSAVVGSDNRVTNAPALVVIPAAFTSSVGKYFTEAMETYYSTPEEFKLSGGVVGQFNLFGKMLSEATQYRIKSSELKRSLSAYNADCVVPAIALGRLSGPGIVPETGQPGTLTGTTAILGSTNLVETLATANSSAILTTYYPYSPTDTAWVSAASAERSIDTSAAALSQYAGGGITVSCYTAWAILSTDLAKHAAVLLEADSQTWERTGTAVPFESVFTQMLEKTYAAGGTTRAGYSQPQGFVLQTAMVNSMRGTFRAAAVQTGNNEVLQSVMLTQAEAQQKSAWAASFHVFNNMMGYVFTVLQAFIFGMTPFIVVALVIPGMGRAIFTNYAQILVWLTLWQPLLSIINFILVLFGSESVTGVVESQGGFTMNNDSLISEKTSDLVTAAGFLGTMVPLLSWGVVKGAMAFTEFISAGVGSAFATQAGAAAATGNVSLGNMSMGNTSMNKYSTMMSSQVGVQSVDVAMGAGAMTTKQDGGGGGLMMNAASVSLGQDHTKTKSQALSDSEAIGRTLSSMDGKSWSKGALMDRAAGNGYSQSEQRVATMLLSRLEAIQRSSGAGENHSETRTAGNSQSYSDKGSAEQSANYSGGAGLKMGGEFGGDPAGGGKGAGGGAKGMGANIAMNGQRKQDNSYGQDAQDSRSTGDQAARSHSVEKNKVGLSDVTSMQTGDGHNITSGSTSDSRNGVSMNEAAQIQQAISEALTENRTITKMLQDQESVTDKFSSSQGMSMSGFNQHQSAMEAKSAALTASMGGATAAASGMQSSLAAKQGSVDSNHARVSSNVAGRLGSGQPSGAGGGLDTSSFKKQQQEVGDEIDRAAKARDRAFVKQSHGAAVARHQNVGEAVRSERGGRGVLHVKTPGTGATPLSNAGSLLGIKP